MFITDLPLFSMLHTRMQWHRERQRVLAQNVANSDTRDFQARDLAPLRFEQSVSPGAMMVSLRRTDGGHLTSAGGSLTGIQTGQSRSFETRRSGSAVNLEDEMMKVAANQMGSGRGTKDSPRGSVRPGTRIRLPGGPALGHERG